MNCKNCGTQINDNSAFCPMCGMQTDSDPNDVTAQANSEMPPKQYHMPPETAPQKPVKGKSKATTAIICAAALLLIAIIGVCAWFFTKNGDKGSDKVSAVQTSEASLTDKVSAVQTSEASPTENTTVYVNLRQILEDYTDKNIVGFCESDYDCDGVDEAFGVISDTSPDICKSDDAPLFDNCKVVFIKGDGVTFIKSFEYLPPSGDDKVGEIVTAGQDSFFTVVQHGYGSGSFTYIWGVSKGEPFEANISHNCAEFNADGKGGFEGSYVDYYPVGGRYGYTIYYKFNRTSGLFVQTGSNSDETAKMEIEIATRADYKPFAFRNSNGKLTGIDIEIMNELCSRMHMKAVFVEMDFDEMCPTVESGKCVMAIGALEDTGERRKLVDFSDYYISDGDKHYSIAAIKDYGSLVDEINEKIAEMIKDGTIDKIANKY